METPVRAALVIAPKMYVSLAAKFLLAAGGDRALAAAMSDAFRAPMRVAALIKAGPVSAGTTGDGTFGQILDDVSAASGAFFESLQSESVFFAMLARGFRRVPLRTRLGVVSASASGYILGEGKPVPISSLTMSGPEIAPLTAAAFIVVSAEVARSMGAAAMALVDNEVRKAATAVVDAKFLALVSAGAPSTASGGNTLAKLKSDLKVLLDAVNKTGAGQLFFVMGPDVANGASILDDRLAMTPMGGELLGLPAMVSSVMPAKTIRLIDASGIAANAEAVDLAASDQADIEMASSALVQDAGTGTGTNLVSMFQSNAKAIKATVRFACEKVRADAVAEITNCQWGAA